MEDLISQVIEKYGVFAGLLVAAVYFYQRYIDKLWRERLSDKDAEIERLVKDRNRLQEIVLNKRLSSGDNNAGLG